MDTSLFELATGYKLFEGQNSVDDFLAEIDNFHDCCCHEIRLLYDACVFSDGVMLDNTGLHIKLLFHSQDKNYPAFEIIFTDVQKFIIGEKYLGASYSYSMGFESSHFFICGNPESLHIESNEACYKILPLYSLPLKNDNTDLDIYRNSDISSIIARFAGTDKNEDFTSL